MYKYHLFGQEAANNFLEKNIPLDDSIKKTAMEQGLNAHEIQRVAERANHEVFRQLLPKQENPFFKLANPLQIVKDLNFGPDMSISAFQSDDGKIKGIKIQSKKSYSTFNSSDDVGDDIDAKSLFEINDDDKDKPSEEKESKIKIMDNLKDNKNIMDNKYKEVMRLLQEIKAKLTESVKEAELEGVEPEQIKSAALKTLPEHAPIINDFFQSYKIDEYFKLAKVMNKSHLHKTAGDYLNPQSSMAKSFKEMTRHIANSEIVKQAIENLNSEIERIKSIKDEYIKGKDLKRAKRFL